MSPIRTRIFESPENGCAQVASEIAQLVRERSTLGRKLVLGLAIGDATLPLYDELAYLHREEGLSFKNVVTFNVSEYRGLDSAHPCSARAFMDRHLFSLIDIPKTNIHFLNGVVPAHQIEKHCADYEKKITRAGGIDYQILCTGRSGSIGANEPGSPIDSLTRLVKLTPSTRVDAQVHFPAPADVPTHAITMGCRTILDAKRIVLLAWGLKRCRIIRRTLDGAVSHALSASYLRTHPGASVYLDTYSASLLRK
jgi:glucosamine-6-phosphate deaminase